MKRKIVILAGLIAAFALVSAGCGGKDEGNAVTAGELPGADADIAARKNTGRGKGKLVELDIAGEYDQFSTAWDGRVIVCKDDKWGLVTYEGEELIPLEYTGFLPKNNDGQVVFVKDDVRSVFDQDGNLLLETEQGQWISCVSDGVVLVGGQNQDTYKKYVQYQTLDGEVIYRSDPDADVIGVGFNEGFTFVGGESGAIRLTADGNYTSMADLWAGGAMRAETVQGDNPDSTVEIRAYPSGMYHNGYYVSHGSIYVDGSSVWSGYCVSDAEGKELYMFQEGDFLEYAGYDPDEYNATDPNKHRGIRGYSANGGFCYSYGTIINAYVEDGDQRTCYLIDLAKLDWERGDGDSAYAPGKMVITDEALLAVGDDISLSDNKYWWYSKDGKYGYIDHEGNVMEMFDDATGFEDGRAAVIEDGQAYLIDEEFKRTKTGIAADSVGRGGEMIVLQNGDEKTYFVLKD